MPNARPLALAVALGLIALASGRRCRAQEEARRHAQGAADQRRLQRFLRRRQRRLAEAEPGAADRRGHRAGPARRARAATAARPARRVHAVAAERGAEGAGRLLGQRPGRGRRGKGRLQPDRAAARPHRCDQEGQGRAGLDRRAAPDRHPGRVQLRRRRRPEGAGPPHRLLHAGRHGPARPGLLHPHRRRHRGADGPLPHLRQADPDPDRHPGRPARGRHPVGAADRDRAGAQRQVADRHQQPVQQLRADLDQGVEQAVPQPAARRLPQGAGRQRRPGVDGRPRTCSSSSTA